MSHIAAQLAARLLDKRAGVQGIVFEAALGAQSGGEISGPLGCQVRRVNAAGGQFAAPGQRRCPQQFAARIDFTAQCNKLDRFDLQAVEQARNESPESTVVIIADEKSATGVLIDLMDQIRLAGVTNISVAAEEGG